MLRQPFLNESVVILRAPTQVWCAASGAIERSLDGVYFSDVRLLSIVRVRFAGDAGEHIQTVPDGADTVSFLTVLRGIDGPQQDPQVRAIEHRAVSTSGLSDRITIESARDEDVTFELTVELESDLADLGLVRGGGRGDPVEMTIDGAEATWANDEVTVRLDAGAASIDRTAEGVVLRWNVTVPARESATVEWTITATDSAAVVSGVSTQTSWTTPDPTGDDRLDRWLAQALVDLDALRMTASAAPGLKFLAAGAPWYFTLFGRDSLWAARFLLPLGGTIAMDTVRVLARLQGTAVDVDSAEQPGKIMHEIRRQTLGLDGGAIQIPPLYYGTIDATALWITLLAECVDAGLASEDDLRDLQPSLEAALAWLRDFGDADGDGFLEYLDESGRGLANQGWKDSPDSVQWRDGRLAEGPIALCEVQAYAYEASVNGARLIEQLGGDGAQWRDWAATLKAGFARAFWVSDERGRFPAIALDAQKRPVDSLTSNIGHLLGTGILSDEEAAIVAARLVTPELSSGFGLRTLSTDAVGFWPLSYHCGSVWAHDTAIAIRGLAADGFTDAAAELTEGLLAAAASFDYRMPELHSGDAGLARAVPYPASCRPQAWSAAAAVAVWAARG